MNNEITTLIVTQKMIASVVAIISDLMDLRAELDRKISIDKDLLSNIEFYAYIRINDYLEDKHIELEELNKHLLV